VNDYDEQLAAGWHADRDDPLVTRFWNGEKWTDERRWSGTDWVHGFAPPVRATPGGPPVVPSVAAAGRLGAALAGATTTFKCLLGATFATVIGYFVPVAVVTGDSGASEAVNLADAGGIGVLIPAAAAATLWLAWPARQGVVSRGRLWGIGAIAGLIGLFAVGGVVAMGHTTREEDFGVTTITQSQTVDPGLGLLLLLAAVAAQAVGIYLAIRDRRKALG
jgi:hypothetical protein